VVKKTVRNLLSICRAGCFCLAHSEQRCFWLAITVFLPTDPIRYAKDYCNTLYDVNTGKLMYSSTIDWGTVSLLCVQSALSTYAADQHKGV